MANTQDNSAAIGKELHHIMDHARALVDATSGELDDRIKSARAALNERLVSAQSEFGDLGGQLMTKIQAADDFVHAKPYYALGGTFISGLLLGWFMSRK